MPIETMKQEFREIESFLLSKSKYHAAMAERDIALGQSSEVNTNISGVYSKMADDLNKSYNKIDLNI